MLVLVVLVLAGGSGVALGAVGDQSVAYQLHPSHDGFVADAGLATPLAEQWSVALPAAVSYPLIVNGMVFVTAADSRLYAVNQATGAIVWSAELGGALPMAGLAYDRGQVFAVNFDGTLTAFDPATGAINWSVALLNGEYFFDAPPTAANGVVYVSGAGGGTTVFAVRESDGSLLWKQPILGGGNHTDPAVGDEAVYVTYACETDYAFALTSGDPLWRHSGSCTGGGGHTPVFADGTLFARDTDLDNGNLMLSADTGATLGAYDAGPAPAVGGGVAFILSGSTLSAVGDSGQGATLWEFTGDGNLDSAPLVVGDLVFVGSSTGALYAVDKDTGVAAWTTDVGSSIDAPAEETYTEPLTGLGAANGTLVVPAGDDLVAYATAGAGARPPVDRTPPTIDGTAQVGELLTADVGSWSDLPSSYAYQWERCDATAANCTDIAGATSASFGPAAVDIGSTFRVAVSAANTTGSSTEVTSAGSGPVIEARPTSQSLPATSGIAQDGQTLTTTTGTWSGQPTSFAYQWLICGQGAPPLFCSAIPGATSSSYTVGSSDVQFLLEASVTATNAGGDSDTAYSAATGIVAPSTPVNASPPEIWGGATEGLTLSVNPGSWSPEAPTDFAYQWLSCTTSTGGCEAIAGATGTTYVLQPTDLGRYVTVTATATNAGGTTGPVEATAIGPILVAPPIPETLPTISGTPAQGQQLIADPGTWSGNPTAYGYQWSRCGDSPWSCVAIPGATSQEYLAGPGDVSQTLLVAVTATNPGGDSLAAQSQQTSPVAAAQPVAPSPEASAPPAPEPSVALSPTAKADTPTPSIRLASTPTAASPDEPVQRPAAATFTTGKVRIRRDGSIALAELATTRGAFRAVATTLSTSLSPPGGTCRPRCSSSGSNDAYGTGTASATRLKTVTLVIKPSRTARIALASGRTIHVRISVTFKPADSGAQITRTDSLIVKTAPSVGRNP
jgi:outer membrane protein assembly factor BamB